LTGSEIFSAPLLVGLRDHSVTHSNPLADVFHHTDPCRVKVKWQEADRIATEEANSISPLDNTASLDAAEVPNEWAEAREPSRTPQGRRATKDEVFATIEALTPGELLKLKCFAAWRIRGLGRACCGRTWEDLLSEAKLSSLRGAASHLGRCWNRNVDLVTHLAGAMRSISNHWKRDFNEQEAVLESEIVTCEEKDDSTSRLKNAVSEYPSQEREVAARQEWDLIAIRCHDDPAATQVPAHVLGSPNHGPTCLAS
jgi:hypothetical protein